MYSREEIAAEIKRRSNAKSQSMNPQMQSSDQQNMDSAQYQENPFMSAATGFNTAFERPVQGLMQLATGDRWKGLHDVAAKRESDYSRSYEANPGSTLTGDVLGNIGLGMGTGGGFTSLAGKLAPIVKNAPYLKNILAGILGGGSLGGAQYVEPNESRLENAAEGALIGGGLSAAIPGIARAIPMAARGISRTVGNEGRMMKDFLKNFSPEEMKAALENKSISDRLGTKMTPAEAGDSRIAAKKEAKLGYTDEGERNLYEYDKLKKKLDEESIKKLLKDISPASENAYEEIRNIGKKIITDKEKALQARARPYYKASEAQTIEPSKLQDLTKNGIIEQELKHVINNQKYRTEIEGVDINSIKVLDIVKKRIDGLMNAAKRSGNNDDARLYKKAKDSLVSAMDEVSPDYKKARAIYSEESPLIDKLRNRQIGKISRLNDDQIKQVGNIIFDSADIDNKSIARMASEFGKESPETWNRIIRNYMENTLDTSYAGRTGYHGTNFFNQFLAKDKSFDKLTTALSSNPQAQETLKEMRQVFKLIQNQPTSKGAAAQSRSHVDVSRNWLAETKKFFQRATGGHYDKAMIDIITTDKWQKAFEKALSEPNGQVKTEKFMELLDKISSTGAKAAAAKATETKGPFMVTAEGHEIYD